MPPRDLIYKKLHRRKLRSSEDEYLPATFVAFDKPHPVMKVPGTGACRWDQHIGRWVVGRLSYEKA